MAGSDIATGAGQGALTGSALGPWGTVVGAGVGAIAGYFGGRSARDAQRQKERLMEKAYNQLSPKKALKYQAKFLPLYRQQIAGAEGPQVQEQIMDNIAQHGLTGTGIGETLRGAAFAAPGVMAFDRSLAAAHDLQMQRANALLKQADATQIKVNPWQQALGQGANTFLTLSAMRPRQAAPTAAPNLFPTSNYTPGFGSTFDPSYGSGTFGGDPAYSGSY